ncbi:MAG: glutamine--scyllo-inositol aminotransferase [Bacteroidetes bacterium GWF2_42_66]|nr:MAG: glutamine--scyllo-inositol aminotransferase [Bacteroidetes bacterium GWA2_42_15]OFY00342.1 MAG: glutamine--scyllo-inositol aminotransferase [Bacteroidetes bacterium GWE2_42_39]OFY47088.1 MAG: glutamine--scyllo-inositol aminotransferase [Bacteroidetes bacterium GWF2_42_66]HBL76742.1 DegT/DnrJ/EryC1/StrS family aminotransferase [Prolixibacteraceae bacterium]HCU62877.1 DegT/DnrJ/EryC1/StrS family aminotransferase [Prolixibacteraceae bacterium]
MKTNDLSRRHFIGTVSLSTVGLAASGAIPVIGNTSGNTGKLAILGGDPVVKNKVWPQWPYIDEKMIAQVNETVKSGLWGRINNPKNGTVARFEEEYAKMIGVKGCVATGSGTQALNTVVEAMGIGPSDEVITSPYTDMGTIASILVSRALPVMADIDKESFQIDPDDVERKITKNTKAIMPVHMMGQPCHLERIIAIAKKHNLRVIEDACQAHFAQYQGKTIGTIGDAGCFSFQTSKTIACGEGGGIISNDEKLLDDCYTVQNHGTNKQGQSVTIGSKYRMNELEGALLLAQLSTARERFETRNRNAAYLTSKLKGFPGLRPQKLYEGTQSGSFYLYTMAYHQEHFNGAPRDKFIKAVAAEGISLSPYIRNGLHREPWTDHILTLNEYKTMYSSERLKKFKEELILPNCDHVCANMVMLWASGPLLAAESDMDDVINAIMKVYENRDKLNSI